MPAKKKTVRSIIIVSAATTREDKEKFDAACHGRGMLIKTVIAKLLAWFVALDKTEQALLMGELHEDEADAFVNGKLSRRRKAVQRG